MLCDGGYVDGSWTITVRVEDLDVEQTLRVHGDLHVGGLIRKLIEECCQPHNGEDSVSGLFTQRHNWSDHALYWVEKRQWLLHYRSTLDQYGLQSDSSLRFLKMHNPVWIQLPDLQTREFQLNFSKSVFTLVSQICKEVGVRHAEELSLARPFPIRNSLNRRRVNSISHQRALKYSTLSQNESFSQSDPTSPMKYSLGDLSSPYKNYDALPSPIFECPNTPCSTNSRHSGHSFFNYRFGSHTTPNSRREASEIVKTKNGHSFNLMDTADPDHSQSFLTIPRSAEWCASNNGQLASTPSQYNPITSSQRGFFHSSRENTLNRPRRFNSVDLHSPCTPTPSILHPNTLYCPEDEVSESAMVGFIEGCEKRGVPQLRTHLLRARATGLWLDSSKGLLEQGIEPHIYQSTRPLLALRFKYFNFYDLNPQCDTIRIHQLFQQARWSILSEDLDTTEEECLWFATLQYHLTLLKLAGETYNMSVDSLSSFKHIAEKQDTHSLLEEVDEMLDELARTLETDDVKDSVVSCNGSTYLADCIKCHKSGKLSFTGYKKYWLILQPGSSFIECYRSKEAAESNQGEPLEVWPLPHCLIQNECRYHGRRFIIRISFPGGVTPSEVKLKFSNEELFSKWLLACQRGATLKNTVERVNAKSAVSPKAVLKYSTVSVNAGTQSKTTSTCNLNQLSHDLAQNKNNVIDWRDYVSQKYFKRLGARVIRMKVLEAYSRVQQFSAIECKMEYLRAWQRLPTFGMSYFMVRQRGSKREEFLSVTPTRILLLDYNTKQIKRSWLFSELKAWNVNWQVQEVVLHFQRETFAFTPMFCTCKAVHEFVGGYICLALRRPEKNQHLDEATFRKYTSDMCTGGSIM